MERAVKKANFEDIDAIICGEQMVYENYVNIPNNHKMSWRNNDLRDFSYICGKITNRIQLCARIL